MNSEPLVWLNQSLLAFGSVYVVLFGVAALALLAARHCSRRVEALTVLSSASLRRDRLRFLLPIATIAFLGTAAGLANSASSAATEPLEAALAELSPSNETTVVVQHGEYVLNNHGGIPWASVEMLQESGLDALPITVGLASVTDESGELLAPSAAVVLVPDALGLVPGSQIGGDCDRLPVVIGSEAGLTPGSTLVVDGRLAVVAGVESVLGGLGRIPILGTHEHLGACAFPEATASMVLIDSADTQAIGEQLNAAGVQHEIISTSQLVDTYDEFWLGTVAPPQMNLFFQVFLIAVIGSIYVSRTRSLQFQEIRASLASRGVSRAALTSVTALGTATDTAIASVIAIIPFAVLAAATNATQIGLELPVNLRSFGAGLLAGHIVVWFGWLVGDVPVMRRLDIGAELRKVL